MNHQATAPDRTPIAAMTRLVLLIASLVLLASALLGPLRQATPWPSRIDLMAGDQSAITAALAAALRMAALAGCFYLMVLTVLLLVAHLVGAVRLARSLTAIAPKVIRRALAPFAVFSLTIASAAASAHASGPSTPPPAVLMLELNGPAPASMVLVTEPKPTTRTHIVSSGEHFWSIAELELRSSLGREPKSQEIEAYWKRLIDANRDRLRVRDNADLIYVGQQLVLP